MDPETAERTCATLAALGLSAEERVYSTESSIPPNATTRFLYEPYYTSRCELLVDGVRVGYRHYSTTGQLIEEREWRGRVPHGFWRHWNSDGQLISQRYYVNGKMQGDALRWYDNGQLGFYSNSKDGKSVSNSVCLAESGEVRLWTVRNPGEESLRVRCIHCQHHTIAEWSDHAGFSDGGFLYNDGGNLTLFWSVSDPAYRAIVGEGVWPWHLDEDAWLALEDHLLPAPSGGRFRSTNPARCERCAEPIAPPLSNDFFTYLFLPGSISVGKSDSISLGLGKYLRNAT